MRSKNIVLPDIIKVGPYDFKVQAQDTVWFERTGTYGQMVSKCLTIDLVITFDPIIVLDTLIHEIYHAIFFTYNIHSTDGEERVVTALSTGWAAVLRDNPEFIVFQNKVLKNI